MPYISFINAFTASEGIKRYWVIICTEFIQPVRFTPDLPYGSNWGHKIADFVFLPFVSFIIAFIASECIDRV